MARVQHNSDVSDSLYKHRYYFEVLLEAGSVGHLVNYRLKELPGNSGDLEPDTKHPLMQPLASKVGTWLPIGFRHTVKGLSKKYLTLDQHRRLFHLDLEWLNGNL